MIQFRQIDMEFRKKVDAISKVCSGPFGFYLSCFWWKGGDYHKICTDIILRGQEGEIIYKGPCPNGSFFQELKVNSPAFLDEWHKLYNKIYWKKRYSFLMFTVVELSSYYSFNNLKVPGMSKSFVKKMMKIPATEIARKLINSNSSWFHDLHIWVISQGITPADWESFLLLFNTFTEGMMAQPLVQPLRTQKERDTLHREINTFLNLNRK